MSHHQITMPEPAPAWSAPAPRQARWMTWVPLAGAGWAIVGLGGVYGWGFGPAYLALFAALAAWSLQWARQLRQARWSWTYLPAFGFAGWALLDATTRLSASPAASRTRTLDIVAALAAYLLVSQGMEQHRDAAWVDAGFAVAAGLLGLLAIAQILSGSTAVYWHFQVPDANPAGTFFNRNNFAGCMEMLLPLAALAAWRRRHRPGWLAWLAAPALGLAAMVVAASRGGMVALAAEAAAGAALVAIWRRTRPASASSRPGGRGERSGRAVLASGCALTVAIVALAGTARLRARFTGADAAGVTSPQRRELALSSLAMWRARPLAGWGLGTWAQVYPRFARFSSPAIYQYAHDDYLQTLAETGLIGAACGLGFLAAWAQVVWTRLRRAQLTPLAAAAAVGCAGLLLHSAVDFNLHVPADLVLFAVLAAMAAPAAAAKVAS